MVTVKFWLLKEESTTFPHSYVIPARRAYGGVVNHSWLVISLLIMALRHQANSFCPVDSLTYLLKSGIPGFLTTQRLSQPSQDSAVTVPLHIHKRRRHKQ